MFLLDQCYPNRASLLGALFYCIFLKFIFIYFSITVHVQCYFVLVSGVQHSG